MKVKLIAYTPCPEQLISAAAKTCYSSADVDTLLDGLDEEKTKSYLTMLTEIGHESPIEHASFTFAIEGVSRSLLAQITRHRMASFSVQSQRYVREHGFEFVLPHEIEAVPEAKEAFLTIMEDDQKVYEKLTAILEERHKQTFLLDGYSEKEACRRAEKKAIEDARYVLPNACTTKLVMTTNARSLYNFFRLRCCNRAQWEIRELAEEMYRQVYAVAPTLFRKAVPSCVCGTCSEGKMCCGSAGEMKEKYSKIWSETDDN